MAITNHEPIGKCLEQLTLGLQPFVERELKSSYQDIQEHKMIVKVVRNRAATLNILRSEMYVRE